MGDILGRFGRQQVELGRRNADADGHQHRGGRLDGAQQRYHETRGHSVALQPVVGVGVGRLGGCKRRNGRRRNGESKGKMRTTRSRDGLLFVGHHAICALWRGSRASYILCASGCVIGAPWPPPRTHPLARHGNTEKLRYREATRILASSQGVPSRELCSAGVLIGRRCALCLVTSFLLRFEMVILVGKK